MKRTEIEGLLPVVFQRTLRPGSPLDALLDVMEELQAPSEQVLASLERYFSPYRTPDRFVPFLSQWVDLDRLLVDTESPVDWTDAPSFPFGIGRLRELIAASITLSRWRGTVKGLQLFLETATGLPGFEIDDLSPGPSGEPRPFHLVVRAPAAAEANRNLLERMIEMEKPAYVTYELSFNKSA